MRSRVAAAALAALALGGAPAGAAAAPQPVQIQFAAFSPTPLDILPGETVEWTNISQRTHTVTADDGSFGSGDLAGGDRFSQGFTTVGAYAYHCTIHPGMTGEVDVRRVTLGLLPTAALLPGTPVTFTGRTATPGRRVIVERKVAGGYRTVTSATPSAGGSWKVTIRASAGGDYRAVSGTDASETRTLFVSNRAVHVHPTRSGVAVSVTPAAPYARIELQEYLRERFGWWPERGARLDYVSEASFRVRRPARVRVVILARDGWTPLAVSRVLTLKRAHPARSRA